MLPGQTGAMRRWYVFLAALVLLVMTACKGPGPMQVGDATLALAFGVEPLPPEAETAPVVEILPERTSTIPSAPVVKFAIDRKTTWGKVKANLDIARQRGQTVIILVAERRKVRSFRLEDAVDGPALDVIAYTDGKACVRHPDVREAKCVQSGSRSYIDAAFTRELVREAVKGYQVSQAEVDLPTDLHWDDVVRVIDAARTAFMDDPIPVAIRQISADPE